MRRLQVLLFGWAALLSACAPNGNTDPVDASVEPKHDVVIEPSVLDFGIAEVGTRETWTLTVRNRGDFRENVRVATLPKGQVFEVALKDVEKAIAISPGASVQIPVVFEPFVADPAGITDTIEFAVESTDERIPVTLRGVGIDTFLTIDPKDCVEFGYVPLGASATRSVTIGNRGLEPRSVTDVYVQLGTAVFSVTTSDLLHIPGNEERTLAVTYQPTAHISDAGNLRIETDDPGMPTINICLRGTAVGPNARITPMAIDFGNTAVGTPRRRNVRIENRGYPTPGMDPALITLSVIDARIIIPSGSLMQPGEFSLNWGTLPIAIDSGSSVSKLVEYTPMDAGPDSAILEISTNDPDSPTTQIALTGTGIVLNPCQLSITPSSLLLDFGVVNPSLEAVLPVRLENTGTDRCLIDSLQLELGSSSVFSLLNAPPTTTSLNPGEVLTLQVEFKPNGMIASFTGTLGFDVNDLITPHQAIQLRAVAARSCLLIAPEVFDFGETSTGCASETRTVTVYNSCSKSLQLQKISLAGPFQVFSPPTLPQTVTSSQPISVDVRYVPSGAGHEVGGLFLATDERPEPSLVPLSGDGVTGAAVHRDTWKQAQRPKVNVLFVVDNSGSMAPYQQSLANHFDSFIDYALQANIDFNIAVTTTDVTTAGEHGRFAPMNGSRPRIMGWQTPNLKTIFGQNVNVGTDGSSEEQGLEAAREALDPANLAGANAGFLRNDAYLSIIVLSDEADQSPQPYNYYYAYFMGVKGFRNAQQLSFSAIVDTSPASFNLGATYIKMATDTGGAVESIATTNWAQSLQTLSSFAFGQRLRFMMSATPSDPLQIAVSMNGVPTSATNGGNAVWSYLSTPDAIVFDAAYPPPPGADVIAEYPVDCFAP